MIVLRLYWVLPVMMLAVLGALPAAMAQQDRERARQIMAPFTKLEFGKSLLIDRKSQEFVEVSFSDLPDKQKDRMYNRLAFIIEWPAHPQKRGHWKALSNTTVRVFAAYEENEVDLVEYRWVYRGQTLRALARKSVLRLDFQLDEAADNPELNEYGTDELERIKGFVSSVIRLDGKTHTLKRHPYELAIPWPTDLADGVSFCSSPQMNILSMDVYFWFRRVDAFVENRTLSFLFYMKPGQIVGYPGGSTWFSDDFREWVHQRAREQDKVPPTNNP